MRKTVLVTGSAGFIFSNFIRKVVREYKDKYSFVSLDACKGPNMQNNIYVNGGHKFYVADITDRHVMDVIFQVERPDIVVHAAAESFVDSAIADPGAFVHTNVLGTQVVIDACLKWKVSKLIYISTDEVYGHLEDENATAWTETAALNPRNPYSATKLSGEFLVRAASQTHGLVYNVTRSSNNFGPRQHCRNFIPKIIKSVLLQEKMPIYGQGLQMREWIHVDDNCTGVMTVLNAGEDNQTYNISSGYDFRNIEVFHHICNIMEEKYKLPAHKLAEFVTDRPGHDFRYSINSTKLRDLGWKPTWKFKKGLEATVDWYMNNQWWFKTA